MGNTFINDSNVEITAHETTATGQLKEYTLAPHARVFIDWRSEVWFSTIGGSSKLPMQVENQNCYSINSYPSYYRSEETLYVRQRPKCTYP